jgi:hypothetical protein
MDNKIEFKVVSLVNSESVTKGKIYDVVYFDSEYVHILNDIEQWDFFPYSNFCSLQEWRKSNINKILSEN